MKAVGDPDWDSVAADSTNRSHSSNPKNIGSRMGSDRSDLPNLDILRAIAVLLVVAGHVLEVIAQKNGTSYHPYDWYLGRLGVLLFFVHTSLVLMLSIRRLESSGQANVTTAFYIRRLFRIYPLSIVCVLLIVTLGVPELPWLTFEKPATATIASNLLLTMNLTQSGTVLAPLWSLPIEVQMYVFLPLIYNYIGPSASLTKLSRLYAIAVAAGLIAPMISARMSVATFAPCFMAGVLAYSLQRRRQAPLLPAWLWPIALASTVAVYVVVEDATEGVHHQLLQWSTCLAVGILIPAFAQSQLRWLNDAAQSVAKYSYGIYLFHCVALWIGCFLLDVPVFAGWTIAGIALLAMSLLGYHVLERPAIGLGARLAVAQGHRKLLGANL